ncbi:MAG: WYL domain-containing protein [Anaerolineae bacterium]|nr:WYL domain-containing protein [Anaerolineae bacterium]
MVAAFEARTWYQLRAAAQALRLPFDTRWTRCQARERLCRRMIAEGELKRRHARLTRRDRRALQSLQAAGGAMQRARFTRHFGRIRTCRQRHPESERAVWRYPYSTAERLWLFGFVEIVRGRPERVILTEDAARLLPPLPLPVWDAPPQKARLGDAWAALCRDLAAWLGALCAVAPRLLRGGWIAPSALRAAAERLPHPEPLEGVRSELGAGRLRFLHYLAQAAGLVGEADGRLIPTAAAWDWLERPARDQWEGLWAALTADRQAGGVLWRRFRLPDASDAAWEALTRLLRGLRPGRYSLRSVIDAVTPYCPPDPDRWDAADARLEAAAVALLDTVFAWSGIAARAGDQIEIPARQDPPRQEAQIEALPSALLIRLPPFPDPAALAKALAWVGVEAWTLIVDAEAVRRAAAQGVSASAAAAILAALCGPLPIAWRDRLKAWERDAGALRLRRVPVLTAEDPAALDALCADRGLRRLIDQPLGRHHLAVHADQVEALCRRLERRGQPVTHALSANAPGPGIEDQRRNTSPLDPLSIAWRGEAKRSAAGVRTLEGSEVRHGRVPNQVASSGSLDPANAAYAYLAMRVFQGLADFAPLPMCLPAAARNSVAECVSDREALDDLDRMAGRVLESLNRVIQGDAPPSPVFDAPAESVRAALRHAYEGQGEVTIDYLSPARGAITTRRIAPLRWIERDGAVYVEAWCDLDGDARTFRLDRVLRIAPSRDPCDTVRSDQ